MRKFFLMGVCLPLIIRLNAQLPQGRVIYERTVQMEIRVNDDDQISSRLPQTQTDKYELSFGNNRSLWKRSDEEMNTQEELGGDGVQIRMVTPGQNDVTYCDFSLSKKVDQRNIFDKNFLVEDSIHKLNWKLTGETSTILGHVCQKAIAQTFGKRMEMNIDNGKMERKEISDTTQVVAWFTSDIPAPAGPEYPGQLPGLILRLDMNNGRMTYVAIDISSKVDLASIKQPTKGKKLTPDQLVEERNKMMDEMQKNNEGSGNRIIIRN